MPKRPRVVLLAMCVGSLFVAGSVLFFMFGSGSNQMSNRRWTRLVGVVVDQNDRPVAGARISGKYRVLASPIEPDAVTDADGRFELERARLPLVLHAATPDGAFAGIENVGPETAEITIPLGPTAEVRGRLINSTGAALPQVRLRCAVPVQYEDEDAFVHSFGSTTITEEDGKYVLPRLVPGRTYTLTCDQVVNGSPSVSTVIVAVTPDAGEIIDVGNTVLSRLDSYSIDERTAMLFDAKRDLPGRIEKARGAAARETTRVLLIFAEPQSPVCRNLLELLYDDDSVRNALWNYERIGIDITTPAAAAAAREYNVEFTSENVPVLVVLDPEGMPVAATSLAAAGMAMRDSVLTILTDNAPELPDAGLLLANALETAQRDDKRVFVQYSAAWCGPCRRLSSFMDTESDLLSIDYLHVRIDVERSPHAADLMDRHRPESQGGIPWFAILDAEGRVLVTSDGPVGNIGFPSDTADIDYFLSILEQTAILLTAEELEEIRRRLVAHQ